MEDSALSKEAYSERTKPTTTMTTSNDLPKFSGEKLSNNLQILIKNQNVTISELGRYTKVPVTTLKRIKFNQNANPTLATLIPVANFFSVTLNQLVGIDPLPERKMIGKYATKGDEWTHIPIISWSEAINWEGNLEEKNFEVISTDIKIGKNSFALKIENDDWNNFLKDSILIIDSTLVPQNRDYVVVYKKGQHKATFKELLLDEENMYLKPLNRDFNTVLMGNNYKILGVMVQVRLDLKS
jgi:SOS-response transcriptional repressor LexA